MDIKKYIDSLIKKGTVKNRSEFARRVGVCDSVVSRWYLGKTEPNRGSWTIIENTFK